MGYHANNVSEAFAGFLGFDQSIRQEAVAIFGLSCQSRRQQMKSRLFLVLLMAFATVKVANADPTSFQINHLVVGTNGAIEDFSIANYVFGSTNWIDAVDDGVPQFFNVEVNSGLSGKPNFDFELTLNYAAYDIGFFGGGPVTVELLGIKPPGSLSPITDVVVKDPMGNLFGNFSTDGSNIFANYTVQDVLNINSGIVTIKWTQTVIPEPSTFSLIALSGIALLSRRRR